MITAERRSATTFSPRPLTAAGSLKIRRASVASIRVTSTDSRHGPAWVWTRSSPSGGIETSLPPSTDGWTESRVLSGPTFASRFPPASRPSQQPTTPMSRISAMSRARRSRVPRHHGDRTARRVRCHARRGSAPGAASVMSPAYPITLRNQTSTLHDARCSGMIATC